VVPTLTAKILPPETPPSFLPRRGLEPRLAEAMVRRLTLVVAGPGFGKSTVLSAWSRDVRCAWYTLDRSDRVLPVFGKGLIDALRVRLPGIPVDLIRAVEATAGPDADEPARADALAGMLCESLDRELTADLALVLDDVDEVGEDRPMSTLIEGMVRQAPAPFHLVLSSRTEPPFPVERLRGRGQVLDVGPAHLRFEPDEVRALLEASLGTGDHDLAGRVHAMTEGWPAAVRLAVEALRGVPPEEWPRTLEGVRRPGGPLFAYLAEEVFSREPADVRDLVRFAAILDRFTPELCEALGVPDPAGTVDRLLRRGLFLEPQGGADGWYRLNPLIGDFARERLTLGDGERAEALRRAARWFEGKGLLEEAMRSYAEIDDRPAVAGILEAHGARILASGSVETVLQARELLTEGLLTPVILQLDGQARMVRGDWEGALAAFRLAAAGAVDLPPGLAWRMGQIHHLRGELDEALEVYGRGRTGTGEHHDEALLLASTATVHWLRGDAESCRALAGRAGEAAEAAGDPQAEAAVHTTRAMLAALDGDRRANDAHYLRALDAAERAHDTLQVIRIRTNRASRFNEEGDYEEALRELDIAIRLAEVTGYAAFLALGLNNRAESRFRLGALDQALTDYRSSRAIYQRIGSRMVCYPLAGLGDVYRERGDLALARAAYEEAVAVAVEAGDVQGLVPAQAGLARVLAEDDLDRARSLAQEAVASGPGMGYVAALLAAGWVELAGEDREAAGGFGSQAAEVARARRDRAGLAEALVLEALSAPKAAERRDLIEEAASIWRELGDPLGTAKAELALGRLAGGRGGTGEADRAEAVLRSLGVRVGVRAAAGVVSAVDRSERPPVAIQALGGFRVLRDGRPVPLSEWQSKKARDLLKLLVARRGRPAPRDFLMEALWPGEDPGKLANRLSVALTTVRGVLDPDRRFPHERFVQADKDAVRLDTAEVEIDVERFLDDASKGLRPRAGTRDSKAIPLLTAAEAAYTGDFLEENAYDDWAVPIREEARATYVAVARALAEVAVARKENDAAVRFLLRIAERDPYDEEAYLGLVSVLSASGSHGEARRHYRMYRARMEELGVEPAPFPGRT
jgi:ATP/maltotriose-dependent transcriptional regulator MalT/DNA-binding SARP family transcriptional activator